MNRFANIKTKKTSEGKQYYREAFIPKVSDLEGDVYFITERGDRLDLLAFEFYKDVSLWWVLAAANPTITRRDSYYVEPGKQFKVPANPQVIIEDYRDLNDNR